ncbi:MAG: DUF4293 domain-containing protein [Sphingobacteriales bacterium]|nr:MAG: DUF4293 domain-containing protein [Sphingobacteriales bacterium]
MIQRIQSVYLLLTAIFSSIFIFTPFAISGDTILKTLNYTSLVALSALVVIVSLTTVFLYKNRNLQVNLCRLATLLIAAILGAGIFYALTTPGNDSPHYGTAFPLLGAIFVLLAIRGVKNDIKLIRSMDRLR